MNETIFEHTDRDGVAITVFTDVNFPAGHYVCNVRSTDASIGYYSRIGCYLDVEARKELILALQKSLPQTDQMAGSEEYLQAATEEETAECEKFPLGLVSKRSHDRQRALDIIAAMRCYCAANKYVPEEWVTELAALLRTQGKIDE